MPIWTAPSQRADQRAAVTQWRAERARMAGKRSIGRVRRHGGFTSAVNENGQVGRGRTAHRGQG